MGAGKDQWNFLGRLLWRQPPGSLLYPCLFLIHLVVVAFRLSLHPRTSGLRPSPAHAGVSHSTWAVTLGRNLVSASPFLNL